MCSDGVGGCSLTTGGPDWGGVMPPNESFLAKAPKEAALEPDLPIIDTHLHLWQLFPEQPYLWKEHATDVEVSGHNVVSSVYVECNAFYRTSGPEYLKPIGETEHATKQAYEAARASITESKIAEAIVGFADLTLGDRVEETLYAHMAASDGRFRGVRQRAKWDPDPSVRGSWGERQPHLYLSDSFQAGFSKLGPLGLSFDASIYHPQLPDVIELAKRFPDTSVVIIHSASPVGHSSYAGRESENHANWCKWMRELAELPNTSVKMGGILMNVASWDFTKAERPLNSEELAQLWRPWIEPCIEFFGPERAMVSSNFPVERVGLPYGTIWNMFKRITAGYSPDEKRYVYSQTAKQIYKLG